MSELREERKAPVGDVHQSEDQDAAAGRHGQDVGLAAKLGNARMGRVLSSGVHRVGATLAQELDETVARTIEDRRGRGQPSHGRDEARPGDDWQATENAVRTATSASPVQRDREVEYTHSERDVRGQRPGQSREQRLGEISLEENTEMVRAAGEAADWDQEMDVLRDNARGVYDTLRASFRQTSLALFQAWENHQKVLGAMNRARQEDAALAATIIGIGLSVVSAGAGTLATSTMGRVAGRFANVGTTTPKAIESSFVELLKQGIQVGGGAVLKPDVGDLPELGDASSVEDFHRRGLTAIDRERAVVSNAIRWMTNNRARLEGHFRPATWVLMLSPQWANLLAGAEGMEASADTKKMELAMWKPWLRDHGAGTEPPGPPGYMGYQDLDPYVKRYVLPHLVQELGVTKQQVYAWAGVRYRPNWHG